VIHTYFYAMESHRLHSSSSLRTSSPRFRRAILSFFFFLASLDVSFFFLLPASILFPLHPVSKCFDEKKIQSVLHCVEGFSFVGLLLESWTCTLTLHPIVA